MVVDGLVNSLALLQRLHLQAVNNRRYRSAGTRQTRTHPAHASSVQPTMHSRHAAKKVPTGPPTPHTHTHLGGHQVEVLGQGVQGGHVLDFAAGAVQGMVVIEADDGGHLGQQGVAVRVATCVCVPCVKPTLVIII